MRTLENATRCSMSLLAFLLLSPAALAGRVPLEFERNVGQAPDPVRYLLRGGGGIVYLAPGELTFAGRQEGVGFRFLGADERCRIVGEDPRRGVSNYFIGNDPAGWRRGVPHVGKVRYQGLYPGIDLVVRPSEYDFELAPWADAGMIRIAVEGVDCAEVTEEGGLRLGGMRHLEPKVFAGEGRREVPGRFVRLGAKEFGFEVEGAAGESLVLDPVFEFGSYLGGSDQEGAGAFPKIAVDAGGSIYVAGDTASPDFPMKSPLDATYGPPGDVFVTGITSDGSTLLFSTYLGGDANRGDYLGGIAIGPNGAIYVAGNTGNFDFPITPGAFQPVFMGFQDGFVTKIAPGGGSLLYSSFLGGSKDEFGKDLAVDASGNAYVVGYTMSSNFPTVNAYMPQCPTYNPPFRDCAFLSKVSPDGTKLVYSTHLGGSGVDDGYGVAVEPDGSVWTTGITASDDFPLVNPVDTVRGYDEIFITHFAPDGQSLLFSTFYGGKNQDFGEDIAVGPAGEVAVVGETLSPDFPLVAPYQSTCKRCGDGKGFVMKLAPGGTRVDFATFLGGQGYDVEHAVVVDSSGNIHIAGQSEGDTLLVSCAPQSLGVPSPGGNGVVASFDTSGLPRYISFLGGAPGAILTGIALDSSDNIYVSGLGVGPGMPVTSGVVQPTFAGGTNDAYFAKLVPGDCLPVEANFDGTPPSGPPPLAVRFTPKLHGPILTHLWDFGDGAASDALSPRHVYSTPGFYDVSLAVSGNGTSDSVLKPRYIHVTSGGIPRKRNILAGPGPSPSNANEVRILSASGVVLRSWRAYGAGKYGTYVAAGNLDDGDAEALTGPGPGSVYGPQVRAFDRAGKPLVKVSFYAYGTLRYGVKTAGGDLDHDWFDEILAGAGPGDVFGPHVRGFNFDGVALTAIPKLSFFAYQTLKFGVNVAAGDIDRDVYAEILTGPGPSPFFSPQARAFDFDGTAVSAIPGTNGNIFPVPQYGLQAASGDVTGDGKADALYGPGPGPSIGARLRGFSLPPLASLPGFDINLFGALSYGLKPGAGDLDQDGRADALTGQGEDPLATTRLRGFSYDGASLTPYPGLDFEAFQAMSYGMNPAAGAFGY